jgi:predicted transport protein
MNNNPFSNLVAELISQGDRDTLIPIEKTLGSILLERFSSKFVSSFRGLKPECKKFVTVFYKGSKDIFSIETQRDSIKITINAKQGQLTDERKLFRDVSKIGHWGNGDYQLKVDHTDDIDYICEIIKQIY